MLNITNSYTQSFPFGNSSINSNQSNSSNNIQSNTNNNTSSNSNSSISLTPREEPFIKPFDEDAYVDERQTAMYELHEAYYVNSVKENMEFANPANHIDLKYNNPEYPYYIEGLHEYEREYAASMEKRYLEGERNVPWTGGGQDPLFNAIFDNGNAIEFDHEEKTYQRELLDSQFQEMLDYHNIEIPKDVRLSFIVNKESGEITVAGANDESLAKSIESIFNQDDIKNLFDHISHTTNNEHSETLTIEYQNGSFLEVGQKDKLVSDSESYKSIGIIDSIIAEGKFNELLAEAGITIPEDVKLIFDIDPSTMRLGWENGVRTITVDLSSTSSLTIKARGEVDYEDLLEDIAKNPDLKNLIEYLILQQEDNKQTLDKYNFVKDVEELTGYDLQKMLIENGNIVTPQKESLVDILKDSIRNDDSIPLWAKEKQIDLYSSKLEQLANDGLDSIANLTLSIEYENGSFISKNQEIEDKSLVSSRFDVYV